MATFTPKRAMPTNVAQQNHPHRRQGNSVSSRKKEAVRNKKFGIEKPKTFNIKANTQNNYMAKWKYVKKLMDREHKKHHALINKRITNDMVEPPVLVAVVGPPGVGKSLLIRSLIKHYTTTNITDCRGPMTILANSTRRITFIECPNDLNAMIDIAKCCDLALLLVDASYGFEMETFEFLNCAQVHGFPRVMGVLTHLDKYVKLKKKQSIVYHVKHRFWKEIYNGAKLFVLKGLDHKTNTYYKSDIQNLVRFISVLKFRPLVWRNSHSYVLCDRYEDLTEPALLHKYGPKKVERSIAFYGYVRGCNLRDAQNVHICGIGDYTIKSVQEMEDPVPTKRTSNKSATLRVLTKNGKVYAPMANLGPVVFDKHAAYITVRADAQSAKREDLKKHSWETEEAYLKRLKREAVQNDESKQLIDIKSGDAAEMVSKLRDDYHQRGIDEKMKSSKLKLFADSKPLTAKDIDALKMQKELEKIERVNDKLSVQRTRDSTQNRIRRRVRFDDEVNYNQKDGKAQLNENAIQWSDGDDDVVDTDGVEQDDDYDFNADLNLDEEDEDGEIEGEHMQQLMRGEEQEDEHAFVSDSDDDDEEEEDIDLDVDAKSESNGKTGFDELWLNSDKEKERKRMEVEKKKAKMQKQKKSKRGSSGSVRESNARWKQNLLANASEIWKKTTTLAEHIYGKTDGEMQGGRRPQHNEADSDSDDEFFKLQETRTMQQNEIDDVDSAVFALNKFNLNKEHYDVNDVPDAEDVDNDDNDDSKEQVDQWWNMENTGIRESIRNRFVTGDWVEAKKYQTEIERRAHGMIDEEIEKDREILEELGAKTEDEGGLNVSEDTLDWEFKLEKLMKEKGVSGDISMEDKLAFAQNGVFGKDEIHDSNAENGGDTTSNQQVLRGDVSTMDLEDLHRLEEKIKKKQQFDREFDSGLLEFDAAFDQTGVSQEGQERVFEKKGDYKNKKKSVDRQGKARGQGGLGMNDRKNLPGSGKGIYYMDLVREDMAKQNELNREEFETETDEMKKKLRGYIPGSYVRIVIDNIPAEFDLNFDLEYPLIIGSLLPQEMQYGFIQCRIKKHRWYKRLLKFNDPLIVSAGWRRYQTCPVYCMEDRNSSMVNKRLRMIKYTPDHLHCLAVFWGPIIPPNTGILGYISSSSDISGFRIAAIGNILSSNLSYKIVKKLKLVGEPMEIHKNTVFVKGMFNSNIEVSKFIGAKLQTVSGIRGSIKKPEGNKGNYRATFEDKLLKSDLIFLKSWVPIKPMNFNYNVRNLLLSDKQSWSGMRTVGQIKYDTNKKSAEFKRDSIYNKEDDIRRNPIRKFNKLVVSKKLEATLPFRLRTKQHRDVRTRKEKHLEAQRYVTKEEKVAQKFISNLALVAANHNERSSEVKRKKRKRKQAFQKDRIQKERLRKRQKIRTKLSGQEETSQWEAQRGNKFHKEWRLQKKK